MSRSEVRVIRFNCPHCARLYELPDALARLPLVCKQCGQRITPPEGSTVPPPAPLPPKVVAPPFSPIPVPPPKPSAKPKSAPVESSKPIAKPQAAVAAAPTAPPVAPPAKPVEPPPPPPPKDDDEPSDDDVLIAKPDSTPDIDFNIGGPTAQTLSEANRPRPSGLSSAHRARPAGLSNTNQAKPPDVDDEPINLELLPRASAPPPTPLKAAEPPKPQPEPTSAEEKPSAGMLPLLVDLVVLVILVVGGVFLGAFLARKPIGDILSGPQFPSIDLLLLIGPAAMFGLVYLLLNSREKTVGAWIRRTRNSPSNSD